MIHQYQFISKNKYRKDSKNEMFLPEKKLRELKS